MVLKHNAAAAASSLTASSTGFPSKSAAISPALSAAVGKSHTSPFKNCSMPRIKRASPQNTGIIAPDLTPLETPTITSSGVNASPEKYLSNISSLVSATAS